MKILLCSQNESVRKRWLAALSPDWTKYQSASVEQALSALKRESMDVVLLHRNSVDEDQIRQLLKAGGAIRVFVLADKPEDKEGASCLRLGCVGYANAYIAPARLNSAVEAVAGGLAWVGSTLMQHLIKGLAGSETKGDGKGPEREESSLLTNLSKREYQIASLVTDGKNNSEIASELQITERTVKAHLSSIYSKTNTKSRLNLALLMTRR